ncbi:uncharacterized protein PG986_004499 [Apiospora aurea]|uniref:Uncharacterized protein n=1 Tax=Apiospora aurea TaxID=335848 RepID=A0ABR1QMS0_9PEZI
MAPPHLAGPYADNRSYYYAARDPTRTRRVSNHHPFISTKRIHSYIQLGLGCFVALDEVGLPAGPHIEHGYGCVCAGFRDAHLLNLLWKWVKVDARILQVEPDAANEVAARLLNEWHLGFMPAEEVFEVLGHWKWRVGQFEMAPSLEAAAHPMM